MKMKVDENIYAISNRFTEKFVSDFCNENKIPLMVDPYSEQFSLKFWCFESDKDTVEQFIYENKPVVIAHEIITVPNQIEYTQQKLIEGVNNGEVQR